MRQNVHIAKKVDSTRNIFQKHLLDMLSKLLRATDRRKRV